MESSIFGGSRNEVPQLFGVHTSAIDYGNADYGHVDMCTSFCGATFLK
jgi:hypothetical protein